MSRIKRLESLALLRGQIRRNGLSVLLAAVALFMPLIACAETLIPAELIAPQTANYSTAIVQRGSYVKTQSNSATPVYPYSTNVQYLGITAKFVEYTVKRGDEVQEGDPLAYVSIDSSAAELTELQLTFTRTQSDYETGKSDRQQAMREAEAALGALTDVYERDIQRLRLKKLGVEYQAYCHAQDLSLVRQQRAIDEALEKRSMTAVVAPFAGIIGDIAYKRPDDAVFDGETLLGMYSTDVLLLRVENASQYFRYNMPTVIECGPANNRDVLTGRVVACDDVVPQNMRGGYAYIQVDPYDEENTNLRNITARVETYRLDNVLLVSRRAVTLQNGKYHVNKLVDGAVQKRYVEFGYNNMIDIWVLGGLSEGETVIID